MLSLSPSPALIPQIPFVVRPQNRDARLDFWRGLCLIDMVLIHLAYADVQMGAWFTKLVTTDTPFAAGGFVFLSGLCIGAIFLPKVVASVRERGHALPVYRRIWRRMLEILLAEYASYAFLTLIEILRGQREAITQPWQFIWRLLLGREGNDLLLLYVVMLAVTPLLLELIRRRLWLVAAAISAAVFAFGSPVVFVPLGKFPPLLWQAVFVSGVLFAPALRRLDAMRRELWWGITAILLLAFAVIFQSAQARYLGLHGWTSLRFVKVPLSFGELLRYLLLTLLIIQLSSAVWPRIGATRAVSFICLLGRNSLLIYVAHLFLQEAVTSIAYRTWDLGAWQIGYAVAMIALLGGIAYLGEGRGNPPKLAANRVAPASELPRVHSEFVPATR